MMPPFAEYVWAAYAVSFAGLVLITLFTLSGWRKAKRSLEVREIQDSETNL